MSSRTLQRTALTGLLAFAFTLLTWAVTAATATAATVGPDGPQGPNGSVTIDMNDLTGNPSQSVVTLIGLTLISLLPAIALTCTAFTKVVIVLGFTRNALGLQQTPPNQVLVGLALFISLFIMSPVLSAINDAGIQPYMSGEMNASAAFQAGMEPLRNWMSQHTGDNELRLLADVSGRDLPETRADVPTTTLIPAFMLSELREAFIIGFLIYIPFLVIDIVVAASLMSLGMMMMPPVMVSLPFKLLLFVMVDGWGLVIKSVVSSYGTGGG